MRQFTRKNPVKSCENLCHRTHLPFFPHLWLLFPSNPTIEAILKGFREEGRRESRFLSSPPSLVSVRKVGKVVVETVVSLLKLCFNIACCAWPAEGRVYKQRFGQFWWFWSKKAQLASGSGDFWQYFQE